MRFVSFVSRPWWQRAWLALFGKSGAVGMAYALVGLGVAAFLIGGYLSALAWAVHEINRQTSDE
jgi:hypothetical protein